MAVPVSDTAHRPKSGEDVMVLSASGVHRTTYYDEDPTPVMFDVPTRGRFIDLENDEDPNPTHWLRVLPTDMPFIKWPDGCTMSEDEKQRLADALADGPSGHIIVLDEAPSYPYLRAAIKRKVLKFCQKGRALDMRNIVRQFDGADRVTAVPEADLPRLFELLGEYEEETFKL